MKRKEVKTFTHKRSHKKKFFFRSTSLCIYMHLSWPHNNFFLLFLYIFLWNNNDNDFVEASLLFCLWKWWRLARLFTFFLILHTKMQIFLEEKMCRWLAVFSWISENHAKIYIILSTKIYTKIYFKKSIKMCVKNSYSQQ